MKFNNKTPQVKILWGVGEDEMVDTDRNIVPNRPFLVRNLEKRCFLILKYSYYVNYLHFTLMYNSVSGK